jgi:hypothetical protein
VLPLVLPLPAIHRQTLTCAQGAPKLIKKKFQPREMGLEANTVSGALRRQPARAGMQCAPDGRTVLENVGDAQQQFTITLERCDLLKVSARCAACIAGLLHAHSPSSIFTFTCSPRLQPRALET